MKINIGELIDKRRVELGLSIREFAEKIHVSAGNAYDITKRESIDVSLLKRISESLDYDFFKHYVKSDDDDEDEDVYIMIKVKKKKLISGDVCSECKYRLCSKNCN